MQRETLESLSKQELIDLVLQLSEQVEQLRHDLFRYQKDSTTSSKPPASDPPDRPKRRRSLRQPSGRRPGGQPGHPGHQQKMVAHPDQVIVHAPSHCQTCHQPLFATPGEVTARRQVREIPPIQVMVIEHQTLAKVCACGYRNEGQFPDEVAAPIQIGPRARGFLIYLHMAHLLPYHRLTQVCQDLFGFPVSEGSLENILAEADRQAQPMMPTILDQIHQGKWVGSDETGLRVTAQRWWLWVWQHAQAVYYAISPRRGYDVVKEHFGEAYQGYLVHDCWSAQNNTVAKAGHQQCHAHLIRDLNFVIDLERSRWAYEMKQFLLATQKAREHIWHAAFETSRRDHIITQYGHQVERLVNRPLLRPEERKLQKRCRKHQASLLVFLTDPDIPFHNNDAEQAIRNAKLKQKISGTFRSQQGAERYTRLLSIIETCKRQHRNLLESIMLLLQHKLVLNST
jgi:transposase